MALLQIPSGFCGATTSTECSQVHRSKGTSIQSSNPGRTMEYCLKMNQELGVTCILPDFFRGVDGRPDPVPAWDQLGKVPCLFINRWLDQIYWCKHQKSIQTFELVVDWEEKLVPYLKSAGAQSVAVVSAHYLLVYQVNNLKKKVGTCFGSYLGVHMSAR